MGMLPQVLYLKHLYTPNILLGRLEAEYDVL